MRHDFGSGFSSFAGNNNNNSKTFVSTLTLEITWVRNYND